MASFGLNGRLAQDNSGWHQTKRFITTVAAELWDDRNVFFYDLQAMEDESGDDDEDDCREDCCGGTTSKSEGISTYHNIPFLLFFTAAPIPWVGNIHLVEMLKKDGYTLWKIMRTTKKKGQLRMIDIGRAVVLPEFPEMMGNQTGVALYGCNSSISELGVFEIYKAVPWRDDYDDYRLFPALSPQHKDHDVFGERTKPRFKYSLRDMLFEVGMLLGTWKGFCFKEYSFQKYNLFNKCMTYTSKWGIFWTQKQNKNKMAVCACTYSWSYKHSDIFMVFFYFIWD